MMINSEKLKVRSALRAIVKDLKGLSRRLANVEKILLQSQDTIDVDPTDEDWVTDLVEDSDDR